MKFKKLLTPLTTIALSIATAFSLPRPSLAEKAGQFVCGTAHGFPVTVVRTEQQNYILIYWIRDLAGLSSDKRCQLVSNRFEQFNRRGQLKYLRSGTVNAFPVICATQYQDSSCSSSNVLMTLHPKDNPNEIVINLINTRVRARKEGSNIYLKGPNERIEPLMQKDGFVSVNIQRLIDFRSGKGIPVFPQD